MLLLLLQSATRFLSEFHWLKWYPNASRSYSTSMSILSVHCFIAQLQLRIFSCIHFSKSLMIYSFKNLRNPNHPAPNHQFTSS